MNIGEKMAAKYVETVKEMLVGLDEDIIAKYIKRVEAEPPYDFAWHTFQPWLEQLCRNVRELTQTMALDSPPLYGIWVDGKWGVDGVGWGVFACDKESLEQVKGNWGTGVVREIPLPMRWWLARGVNMIG